MKRLLGTGLLMMALACGSGGGDDGGDDGPDPGPGSGPGGSPDGGMAELGCSFDDPPCSGETICLSNDCVNAFGRIYKITVASGTTTVSKANGDAWDLFGGAPDPFVGISLNGQQVGVTSVAKDTFSPFWNMFVEAAIPAGSNLTFTVWDEDTSDHDFMFSCAADPLTVIHLRQGFIPCQGDGSSLFVKVTLP